jgi:hypothetical protein
MKAASKGHKQKGIKLPNGLTMPSEQTWFWKRVLKQMRLQPAGKRGKR